MSQSLTDRKRALEVLRKAEVSQAIERNSVPPVACPDVTAEQSTLVVPRRRLEFGVVRGIPHLLPVDSSMAHEYALLEAGFQDGDIVEVSLVSRRGN
jgi:hypothetical protein